MTLLSEFQRFLLLEHIAKAFTIGITNDFTTGMNYKWFDYKNVLQNILLEEYIANNFTIGMHYKLFCYRNSLQIFLRKNGLQMLLQ